MAPQLQVVLPNAILLALWSPSLPDQQVRAAASAPFVPIAELLFTAAHDRPRLYVNVEAICSLEAGTAMDSPRLLQAR